MPGWLFQRAASGRSAPSRSGEHGGGPFAPYKTRKDPRAPSISAGKPLRRSSPAQCADRRSGDTHAIDHARRFGELTPSRATEWPRVRRRRIGCDVRPEPLVRGTLVPKLKDERSTPDTYQHSPEPRPIACASPCDRGARSATGPVIERSASCECMRFAEVLA